MTVCMQNLSTATLSKKFALLIETGNYFLQMKGGDRMNSISKMLPYVRRYVLMGIYDVLDEEGVLYQKEQDAIVAKAEVYGNISTFSISAAEQEMGTEMKVTLLQPCEGLSEQGKERAMTAVADRIVQYLENELLMNNRATRTAEPHGRRDS